VIRAGLRLLEEHEAKTARVTREHLSRVIEIALLDTRPLIPPQNSFVAGGDENLPVLFTTLAEEDLTKLRTTLRVKQSHHSLPSCQIAVPEPAKKNFVGF
jgi:hypothetical protein